MPSRIRPRSAADSALRLLASIRSSPLPATVLAFTDTSQSPGNQDVHVIGLLHGIAAPVIGAQTMRVSKNATTIVHLAASDPDGDPLTWSVGRAADDRGSRVDAADALAATSRSSPRIAWAATLRGDRERRCRPGESGPSA